jgi:hypothetical protein
MIFDDISYDDMLGGFILGMQGKQAPCDIPSVGSGSQDIPV